MEAGHEQGSKRGALCSWKECPFGKENMVIIYNGILLIKKNGIVLFAATWMDPEIIILSKSEREGQEPYDII